MNNQGQKKASWAVAWIPNGITCLSLMCGFAAIILSVNPASGVLDGMSALEFCWILIGAAAVFDFLDGFAARMLHAVSSIGKELDSLCDMVSFGIAPAVMLYRTIETCQPGWHQWVAWLAVMIAVCGALRLAKFNVDTRQTSSFIGLPIPANAIFWIGFMAFISGATVMPDYVAALIIVVVSLLMVSEIPMFSFKIKGPFCFDIVNASRLIVIISALLFVVFMGVEGFMWTIVVYLLLCFAALLFPGRR